MAISIIDNEEGFWLNYYQEEEWGAWISKCYDTVEERNDAIKDVENGKWDIEKPIPPILI